MDRDQPATGAGEHERRTRGGPSRRTVLAALGTGVFTTGMSACGTGEEPQPAGGASPAPSRAVPQCVLAPETIEGPYYIDRRLVRSNLVEDREGLPVELDLTVLDARTCAPLPDTTVDVWHCDAFGYYSGHLDLDPDEAPMPDPHVEPTDPSTFLRGTQFTGADGAVGFHTIYPGWYFGRAIHVHVVLHSGGERVHTGQLYFPEDMNRRVLQRPPYVERESSAQRVPNGDDMLHQRDDGRRSTLRVTRRGADLGDGLRASLTLGVNPDERSEPAPLTTPPN